MIPSIEMIPGKYGVGTLLCPMPLDGSGDFNVSRSASNSATRVNAQGFIETVANNVPRLDYPLGGIANGCPALLVEPSATNIMAQSETLSVSGNWNQTNVLVTGGAIASPDGLASGTLFVATAGASGHSIDRNAATTVASGTVVTTSCFFKAHGTNTFVQMYLGAIVFSPASPFANFNLTGSGSVTAGTYTSAFIQYYGNGWYRCGFSVTTAASGTISYGIVPILASGTARNVIFTGDGVNGVYAWGAQLETGSVATSYIPTTTAPITRGADVINKTGVSSLIGQTEGTIYVEAFIPKISSIFVVGISNGLATSEAVYLQIQPNFSLELLIRSGGSTVNINVAAANWTAGLNKVAFTYGAGSCSLVLNGGLPVTGTVTNVPTCNRITLGSRTDNPGTQSLTDRIRSVALYNSRLDDADLMVLTSPTYYSNVRDMIWDTFVARPSTYSELPGCLQTRHNELITL